MIKITIAALCCLSGFSAQAQVDVLKQKASADSLRKTLTFLASDSLKGRATGSQEQLAAANFIAKHFMQLGLCGASSDKNMPYYNSFDLINTRFPTGYKIRIKESNLEISPYTEMHIVSTQNITNQSFTPYLGNVDSIKSNGVKVVASTSLDSAIAQTSRNLKEYPSIQRFILILNKEQYKIYNKERLTLLFSRAALCNKENDTLLLGWHKETLSLNQNICYAKVLSFVRKNPNVTLFISNEQVLKHLFSDTSLTISNAYNTTEVGKQFVVDGTAYSDMIHFRKVSNVVAKMEGTTKKDEVIFVSAHFDHIGIQSKKKKEEAKADSICNGADDNGSGTSAIMEVARLFAEAKKQGFQPQRTIIFTAFTGEEAGLLGSKAMLENPIAPLTKTKANVNLYMVGRTDSEHTEWDMYAYTIPLGDSLTQQKHIKKAAKMAKIDLSVDLNDHDRELWKNGSDHAPFVQKGIPAIAITTGMHPDYHKPTDEVDKINFKRLERIATFTYYLVWELANSN